MIITFIIIVIYLILSLSCNRVILSTKNEVNKLQHYFDMDLIELF